jgi:hypothetical protein
VQVGLVKRRGREREEEGLNGKMKSLVEWEKKIDLEAKFVAIVIMMILGLGYINCVKWINF